MQYQNASLEAVVFIPHMQRSHLSTWLVMAYAGTRDTVYLTDAEVPLRQGVPV